MTVSCLSVWLSVCLTQRIDGDLPRHGRGDVDADQMYVGVQQHVVWAAGAEGDAQLPGQAPRLLLALPPQRVHLEALGLQQWH